ncbi:TetR family transcriptional regulator [Streptomyces nigrescens]|uniref:TetR family transcriptional regulator n=2 Tax=Streptomyces TaxID=1883 RepID=A0ABM7ZSE1_STRNI|nr:TetR/AcrR family transcriptional regulator [Streptomyces nigrescens]MEE4418349.1 TetR/AcrR family transcriptional regulator [Streptomyces sp. DSM 41528]BDM69301.1 TetR family transcriptional regulator [Streptomyces nigrescens]
MRSEINSGGQNGSVPASGVGDPKGREPERSFIEKARRAQIMDAAVETIAARGFAKASLAQIAERAGISKGVISYHFAGKGELIERLVEQIYEGIGAFVAARLEREAGKAAWLRVYVESVAAYMQDHRSQLAALGEIFGNYRTEEGALHYGVASSEPLYAALEGVFLEGQRNGEFRDFDVRVMAVSLQAGIDHMFAYWSAHPEHDLAAHARQLADLFEHATRADPAPDGAPTAPRSNELH